MFFGVWLELNISHEKLLHEKMQRTHEYSMIEITKTYTKILK